MDGRPTVNVLHIGIDRLRLEDSADEGTVLLDRRQVTWRQPSRQSALYRGQGDNPPARVPCTDDMVSALPPECPVQRTGCQPSSQSALYRGQGDSPPARVPCTGDMTSALAPECPVQVT